MGIRIICDGCGKQRLLPSDYYSMTLSQPRVKEVEPVTTHLCTSCKKKIMQFMTTIEHYVETEDTVADLGNCSIRKAELMKRAKRLDIRKIISLRKAGWTVDNIVGEVDIDKEDIIVDICKYYDITKDEFKELRGPSIEGYCCDDDDVPKKYRTKVEPDKDLTVEAFNRLVSDWYETVVVKQPLELVTKVLRELYLVKSVLTNTAERYCIALSTVIRWRDSFSGYCKGIGVEL